MKHDITVFILVTSNLVPTTPPSPFGTPPKCWFQCNRCCCFSAIENWSSLICHQCCFRNFFYAILQYIVTHWATCNTQTTGRVLRDWGRGGATEIGRSRVPQKIENAITYFQLRGVRFAQEGGTNGHTLAMAQAGRRCSIRNHGCGTKRPRPHFCTVQTARGGSHLRCICCYDLKLQCDRIARSFVFMNDGKLFRSARSIGVRREALEPPGFRSLVFSEPSPETIQ